MDLFIKELTDELSKFKEPTVLVMYGDHIPALEMSEESYKAKNLYQTQYVIWSNFKMQKQDKDIEAYQMTADVMNRLGIHEGMEFSRPAPGCMTRETKIPTAAAMPEVTTKTRMPLSPLPESCCGVRLPTEVMMVHITNGKMPI